MTGLRLLSHAVVGASVTLVVGAIVFLVIALSTNERDKNMHNDTVRGNMQTECLARGGSFVELDVRGRSACLVTPGPR